jgi:hypothetical protein
VVRPPHGTGRPRGSLPWASRSPSNLAHRWTFDEASGSTALDSAGTSNGTLGSSASRTVSFDGSGAITLTPTQQCDLNAHVDFGLAPGQFGTGAFTVSYWLKTTFNGPGSGDLIGNRVDENAGNFLSARLNGSTSEASLEIYENAAGTNGAGVNVSPSPYSIPASFDDVRTYSRELTACDVAVLNTH